MQHQDQNRSGPRAVLDWRVGVALLAAALMAMVAPSVPWLTLVPILALAVVGTWQHVAGVVLAVTVLTFIVADADQDFARLFMAGRVLFAGLGMTLATWFRQRYLGRRNSRHVLHAWVQTPEGGHALEGEPQVVMAGASTVIIWAPALGRTRLVTVTAPDGAVDLLPRVQRLVPLLMGALVPFDVAAEALFDACLPPGDAAGVGALLLDISGRRDIAVATVGNRSAVVLGGEGNTVLEPSRRNHVQGDRAEVEQALPQCGRIAVLAGTGSMSTAWAQAAPTLRNASSAVAAQRLLAFAAEVEAPHDAITVVDLAADLGPRR